MSFHWPYVLCCLLLPLAGLIIELARKGAAAARLHPKILRAEASGSQLSLTAVNAASVTGPKVRWRLWLSLYFAILALARPQWGRIDEPVFDQSREIIIALDLSKSMLAQDVTPSRLERARLLITSLLEQLKGERVGLIVFSGTAFLQSPLSADYEILREFLPALNPDYLPEGGSNYTALLDTTLEAFKSGGASDRYLIVLSDGEATDDTWKDRLPELKKRDIRVISLGIGTSAGAMIPDGAGAFVKDESGAVVLSKLENTTLQELASASSGVYSDASRWVDLAQLLKATVETGRKGEFLEQNRVRLAERFQWALAPALLIFAWSLWREFPARPRIRDVKLAAAKAAAHAVPPIIPPSMPPKLPAATTAALLFLSLTLIGPPRSHAEESPAALLSKLVGQFSARDQLSALNYAELARGTIAYGEKTQAAQQPVPEGPIRDGLAAVDAGQNADAKAADWPDLRSRLEKFLEKPPEQKPEDKKEDQEKKQDEEKKQDSKQDKKNPPEQQQKDQQKSESKSSENKKDASQAQSAFNNMQKDSEKKPAESAPQPQQSDPSQTQKVGGATEKKKDADKNNPELAMQLQKLEQVRDKDSPAQLYQLMQSDQPAPQNKGKNW